ncbi:hypothetical protein GJ496_006789 [Pomphorhynchus laevis]|nr:hypothetical protein GJ496_006789 [Pomphorhynchus laevis]
MAAGPLIKDNIILRPGAQQESGETSRESAFAAALTIGDIVKTTLGPKGMDKILQGSGVNKREIQITNDGATILKSIGADNPVAKILVDISKVQDDEIGDGTTSVTVIASELLRVSDELLQQNMHPQTIIAGWRKALLVALNVLDSLAVDNQHDEREFYQDLMDVASTTLSSKVLGAHKAHFAELCVKAALRIRQHTDLRAIQLIKVNGQSLSDSYLDEGFILQKKVGMNQPQSIKDAKILIANTPMDTDKVKIFGSRVRVDSVAKIAEVEKAEKEKMKAKVQRIISSGCTVFINRQLIYNYPEQLFADSNIMAIEHADFEGVERLALVLDAEIASTFGAIATDKNESGVRLGRCNSIEQMLIGEEQVLRFSGTAISEACTLVIRGSSDQVLEEAERSVHDALCVLSLMLRQCSSTSIALSLPLAYRHNIQVNKPIATSAVVCGGGCVEMHISRAIFEAASNVPGKESIAMESFAKAIRQIPIIISDNGGFDSQQLIALLRASQAAGNMESGLDMDKGQVGDMRKLGVKEAYILKRQILISGTEAAEMILRVDETIKKAPRKRAPDRRHH